MNVRIPCLALLAAILSTSLGFTQSSSCPIVETDQLVPADAVAGQFFGNALDVDLNVAAIGSPNVQFGDVLDAGCVYVYRQTSTGIWEQEDKLFGSAPAFLGHMGLFGSVSVSAETIAVGAPHGFDEFFNLAPGSVFVFENQPLESGDANWVEVAHLQSPKATPGDTFGGSVILDGNTLIVGAPDAVDGRGAVYVYERQVDGSWDFVKTLRPETDQIEYYGHFGESLAYDSDEQVILAGDSSAYISGFNYTGAIYAYRNVDGQWIQEAEIVPPLGDGGGGIGTSVSYQNGRLLTGDIGPISPFEPGSVREFQRVAPGNWQFQSIFHAIDAAPNDRFGSHITQFGDYALVSIAFAPVTGETPNWNTALDLFHFDGQDWQFVERTDPAAEETVSFGFAKAISAEGQLLAGEYLGVNAAGNATGIVRVYNVACASQVIPGDINQDGQVNLLDVEPFVALLSSGEYLEEGDMNGDGAVDLLDVQLFIEVLSN